MNARAHIYLAQLLYDEIYRSGGWVTIKTGYDKELRYDPPLKYKLDSTIYHAIIQNKGCFLAGAVGPDFFPDFLNGQMRIHPENSGQWLDMMFEQLRTLNPHIPEFQRALAFYMGWLTHYCGDMYSHQFINVHSYGWMPGIGQIMEDVKELIDTDDLGDLVAFLDAHLPEGTINEFMETKDFSGIAKKVLGDPEAVKDLIQMFGDSFSYDYGDGELRKQLDEIIGGLEKALKGIKDGSSMDEVRQLLVSCQYFIHRLLPNIKLIPEQKDELTAALATAVQEAQRERPTVTTLRKHVDAVIRLLKAVRPEKPISILIEKACIALRLGVYALNIVRHLAIEKYMGDIIQENLGDRFDKRVYYHLDIPDDFIRRCFTTPDAFRRMLELSDDRGYTSDENILDVLGRYVESYELVYQKMLTEGGDQRVLEDLQLRAKYLNNWVELWRELVQNSLADGFPVPEGRVIETAKMAYLLFAAYENKADADAVRDAEDLITNLDRAYGFFKQIKDVLFGMIFNIASLVIALKYETEIEQVIETVRTTVAPMLIRVANVLIKNGVQSEKSEITEFEDALKLLWHALTTPSYILNCKAVFGVEGLADRLAEEWKNLGREYAEGSDTPVEYWNLECPMMENALQMSKLCLIGSQNLNELYEQQIGGDGPFHSADVIGTVSTMLVEVVRVSGAFQQTGYTLRLDVLARDANGREYLYHSVDLFDAAKKHPGPILKAEIPLARPLTAQELSQCRLSVVRKDGSYENEKSTFRVNIYDKETVLRLFTHQAELCNANRSMNVLPLDRSVTEKTFREKKETSLRINNLHKLRITVTTGSDGTDDVVNFYVLGTNNTVLAGPFSLDRSDLYNDFEANSTDTYELTLPTSLDINRVSGFGICRASDSYSWKLQKVLVKADSDGLGYYITLGNRDFANKKVEDQMEFIPLLTENIKCQEQPLNVHVKRLQIDIKTTDVWWAGTDHDLRIDVMCNGKCVRSADLDASGRDDFEKNHLDAIVVSIAENGVGVWSDAITNFKIVKTKGWRLHEDDWTVSQIVVHDYDTGLLLGIFNANDPERGYTLTDEYGELTFK